MVVSAAVHTIASDIALVKLSKPVKFRRHINVACLPKANEDVAEGSYCLTAGWGHTLEGNGVSISYCILQKYAGGFGMKLID